MNTPDDLTITAPLISPELRSVALAIIDALSDLEAAVGPSGTAGGGKAAGKPGSKPPPGNTKAAKLCREMVRDGDNMAARVAKLYREMDPRELEASKEWRQAVRAMKAEARQAVLVTVSGGKLVAKMPAAGRPHTLAPEQESQVVALCARGLSQRAVAERFEVGQTTVSRLWRAEMGATEG